MANVATPNTENDAQLKTRAMRYILDRICRKYREHNDPTFSQEEVKNQLRGLGPEYVDLNIKDLFKGSGVIDINEDFMLTLNEHGKKSCKKGELLV